MAPSNMGLAGPKGCSPGQCPRDESAPALTSISPVLTPFTWHSLGHAMPSTQTGTPYTFTPMFTTMASRRSKTREVTPSPRSLASPQLQRSMYLVPWVGTAKHSSSPASSSRGRPRHGPARQGHTRAVRMGHNWARSPPCSASPPPFVSPPPPPSSVLPSSVLCTH